MRWASLVAGAALLAAYASLAARVGFRAELGGEFVYVGWREALFWLAHFGLATPGLLLLAHAVGPAFAALRAPRLDARGRRLLVVLYALAVLAVALLGRRYVLLEEPVTDDERSALFAARMIAEGRLSVPAAGLPPGLPLLFTFERRGALYAIDFPGGLLLRALALVTGTGSLLYALLAAAGALAVVYAGAQLDGRRGALTAGALWFLSPMVITLSFTLHAHLAARSLVALALCAYLRLAADRGGARWGALLGAAGGLAFLCRPLEALCVLAPAAAHLGYRAAVGDAAAARRRALLAAAAVALLPVAVFAWYNAQLTGRWYLPARAVPELQASAPLLGLLWQRLGANLGFNALMLAVYFLGPLGVALALAGVGRRPPGTVLAAGVALLLLAALVHDDTGIHVVGPIHYATAAAPLTLLALCALRRGWRALARAGIPAAPAGRLLAAYLLGLLLFTGVHARTLHHQARLTRLPLDAVADLRRAVVVADPPPRLWALRPELAATGSWVVHLPMPDPFLRDEVIFAYPSADPRALVARFPDRAFYRMTYQPSGPPIRLERLVLAERPAPGMDP